MRKAITCGLFVAVLVNQACRNDCDVAITEGLWTYQVKRHVVRGKVVCHFELSYDRRPLLGNATAVTPIGTFEVMEQSEHGDSDSGWKRIKAVKSTDVQIEGAPLTPYEIAALFYPEQELKKRPGTPPEWIYMGGVIEPGWVHPSRLADVNFLKEHPAER